MNIKENVSFHNKFEFKLIDSVSGEVKQTAKAENVVLDQIWTFILSTNAYQLYGVGLGTGTGTPSASDNGLFKEAFIWSSSLTKTAVERVYEDPTSHLTLSFTFPANSGFVGNLTEVGMRVRSGNSEVYVSHAMITDSEGQSIVIEKTALDILIVTTTFYVTITNNIEGFTIYKGLNNTFNSLLWANGIGPGILNMYLSQYYCGGNSYSALDTTLYGSVTRDVTTKTASVVGTRLATSAGNHGYFNAIRIGAHGYFKFPNAAVFAPYTMKGASIGTGDGSTQDFNCPIDLFIQDTDTVYKNGVALTRGVDYTIDNKQNFNRRREIAAWNFSECLTEPAMRVGSTYTRSIPLTMGQPIEVDTSSAPYPAFRTSDVVVCHLKNPDPIIGRQVNTLKFTDFYFYGSSTGSGVFDLTIEGSNNNADWNTFLTVSVSGSDWDVLSSRNYRLNKEVTFDTVEYEYVRITFTSANDYLMNYYPVYYGMSLLRVGDPIHFTVAPASGDILTMDAQIDRPFKNENFVLDSSSSVSFS